MPERFAKLSLSAIARIGELTKREIQVYSYLTLCRNASNGRCDPARSTIAAGCRIGLNHVWLALAGLEYKGWILPDAGGFEFVPIEAIPVPKLGTFPNREGSQIGKSTFPKREVKVPKLGKDVIIVTEQTREQTNEQPMSPKPATATKGDPGKVFDYWILTFDKGPRMTFTDKRRKAVVARLKTKSVMDLFDAIDGCKLSPHHAGQNDTGTVYDDLELICRSDTHVERFIEHKERRPVRKGFADVGRSAGSNPDCPKCSGSGWQSEFPAGIDRDRYNAAGFPCELCAAESFKYCSTEYKLAA